ncbi:MAG: L-histidine N(alpha)-methyltransferase [Dehalococcoidia bacterium]|nr:L-histidine N(alpha)-methyltransferase [Dehalococcoidia bacterium]
MQDENVDNTISYDFKPRLESFLAEVLIGLRKPQKELPSKYFYDERGSQLFERICELKEYYITRIEASIMQAHIKEMVELIGPHVLVIEHGCGNCDKVRFLVDRLHDPVAFIPIDISQEQLLQVAKELDSIYPQLQVLPVCADYTSSFELPVPKRESKRTVVYFPGSTISNFDPIPAKHFLEHIASLCGSGGALLIGVDLKKDPAVLHNAYNDSEGVTAAFNLNLLERINREFDCDFQLDAFEHYAFYNPRESRVEMHLVSQRGQVVHIDGKTISFAKGESIWTENSYKYNLDEFEQMAAAAGFRVERVWVDDRQWFSVQYLVTR